MYTMKNIHTRPYRAFKNNLAFKNNQCIDPFRPFSEGRKTGAKWVDGAKRVEMGRNGSISEFQNFSNEKLPIATEIDSV